MLACKLFSRSPFPRTDNTISQGIAWQYLGSLLLPVIIQTCINALNIQLDIIVTYIVFYQQAKWVLTSFPPDTGRKIWDGLTHTLTFVQSLIFWWKIWLRHLYGICRQQLGHCIMYVAVRNAEYSQYILGWVKWQEMTGTRQEVVNKNKLCFSFFFFTHNKIDQVQALLQQ